MRIVYLGKVSCRNNPLPSLEGDAIELFSDNWDDYGYKTSFSVTCRISDERITLGLIRILIADTKNSSDYLNKLLKEGWSGEFPIPNTNYISTPSNIIFYEQIDGLIDSKKSIEVANKLRDASYLIHVSEDDDAKTLVETEGFESSLQRERGSKKAYLDGWKILARQAIAVLDLGFKFKNVCGDISNLNLKYHSESLLPHDINVLIGPNGSGKSQVLHQMVSDWISPDEEPETGFAEAPNLSQIVVISYSPFERFPVAPPKNQQQDTEAYRYFGFRGRTAPTESRPSGQIRLSHQFPKRNAAEALIECLTDDERFNSVRGWANKVKTVERVLRTAFNFDCAAIEVKGYSGVKDYYKDNSRDTIFHKQDHVHFDEDNGRKKAYIPIVSETAYSLNIPKLKKNIVVDQGVTFFMSGHPIELSSGQRLFAYIVINILGAIQKNSLILIDEPELFLHPTLEIQFVNMLKMILSRFNSKALLATHSAVTVREVPSDCVHVFERTDEGLFIKHPPFQTFGGDVQRISSYVFGDKSISKPFEAWIRDKLEDYGSADELIEAMGNELNEELIVQIKAMGRDQW
ncbi:AAA family ATPase [Hahella aquimaris]|uniref:ATP-binding protein n=1 Tax=Hahella sp. HNIBRBA332 TaxID=3015983 RepID=UPI00273BAB84|nr:AAA family ATPase [Hahella sp. HNIBRBA332]WLQ16260.1 AAA family ATPase [Hahella sp. HNIBRBA332]